MLTFNREKGMSAPLVALLMILAAAGCVWDKPTLQPVDVADVVSPSDVTPDAPADVATDTTDAPTVDVADGGTTDVTPPVDVADVVSPSDVTPDAPADVATDTTDAPTVDVADGGTTDVTPPVDVACPAGLTRCGTSCVNIATDVANCGACGRACASGDACGTGLCERRLRATYARCVYVQAGSTWSEAWGALFSAGWEDLYRTVGAYRSPMGRYYISRFGAHFPPVSIPGAIRGASLQFTPSENSGGTAEYHVVSIDEAAARMSAASYAVSQWGSTSLGSFLASAAPRGEIASVAFVPPSSMDFGAPAGQWIGLRERADLLNIAPGLEDHHLAVSPGGIGDAVEQVFLLLRY